MRAEFRPVSVPDDNDELIEFITNDEWPFHGRRRLSPHDTGDIEFVSPDVQSYWVVEDERIVGLIRLLDLGDIGRGAPQFDLRIAGRSRGCGFGTLATRWIVAHVFDEYPAAHRLEANTRHDNTAMQRALVAAGFTHEGTLRSSWHDEDGRWFDTMVYGVLRSDLDASPPE